MYHRWEIDEEDNAKIEKIVASIINERYPKGRIGVIPILRDCHDVHMEDYYYWLGWIMFFEKRMVYLELKWGSRGFHLDRIGDEIEEKWVLEDISNLKVKTRSVKDDIVLYLDQIGNEIHIMSCPKRYIDPQGPKELISYERRQRAHFMSAESDLKKILS